jgi:hypothetical protein
LISEIRLTWFATGWKSAESCFLAKRRGNGIRQRLLALPLRSWLAS